MNEKLNNYKELLNVLPRNNVKNSRTYVQKAAVMRDEASRVKKQVLREINRRYNETVIPNDNEDLKLAGEHLKDLKNNLYLLNEYNSSYEKSNLNKYLEELKKFYKNDFGIVNSNIKTILDIYNLVGVKITGESFFYGEEVSEYMNLFLTNDINSPVLKDTFDKLYWKDPDLLHHIYLNFRYLYKNNIKEFDKYYENKLKEEGITNKEEFLKGYTEKLWHYIILKESDIKIIQDKFLDGSLDIKEYDYEKVSKLEHDLFVVDMSENERFDCISKLSCTLYEYKNYLRYKDVIDEVKAIYNDKTNKDITKSILKDISKHEGIVVKMNKKIAFRRKLNKNANVEKFYNNMKTSLDELKRLYDEYDEALFKEKVVTLLNDNSSILDLLKLTLAYPINLAKIIKSKNEEITDEQLADEIKHLERFVRYPNNTIVSNITILDERDLSLLILDKYRLMNIMIRVEQLEFVNLDSLITLVKKIFICYIINRSKISYENLVSATEWKKILDRESIE